jgi:[acyl-carrier-protein] S-malonyltransferase
MHRDRLLAFPGQGVPSGTLIEAAGRHRRHPLVRDALRLVGADISSADLRDTRVVQPLVYALSFAAAGGNGAAGQKHDSQAPPPGIRLVLGHSLGELTALAFAGVIDPGDGLEIAGYRGEVCHSHTRARDGQMMAVMGLDDLAVEWARRLAVAQSDAVLEVAAYNGRRQMVLSGDRAGFAALIPIVAGMEGIIAELPIGGSFHSPLMQPAIRDYEAKLGSFDFRSPAIPVLSTIDCVIHDPATAAADDADALRGQLVRGLVLPVRWTEAVGAAAASGIEEALDVGPGETLHKLGRRERTAGLRWVRAEAEVTPA